MIGCGKYAKPFSMADVKESEERYLARIVIDVLELDLGVIKLAALLNVEEVVEPRRIPGVTVEDGSPL